MLKIALGQEPESVEREVSGPFGSFFVTIKPLSLGQRVRYWTCQLANDFEEVIKTRVEHVVGWREVVDASGAEVPFNKENFQRLAGANNSIFSAVGNVVHEVFAGDSTLLPKDVEKN